MYCTCDLDNVKEFIKSDKFAKLLLNNTTDFGTATFILQTLFDKISELEKEDAE